MSAYENIVGGKLKLKGKALDVKAGGIKKKKKHKKQHQDQVTQNDLDLSAASGRFSFSFLGNPHFSIFY